MIVNEAVSAGASSLAQPFAPMPAPDLLRRANEAAGIATFEIGFDGGAGGQLGPDWTALFGAPEPPFDGTYAGWLRLVAEDDRVAVDRQIRDGIARRLPHLALECRLERSAGPLTQVEIRAAFTYGEQGTPVRLTGVAIDRTGRSPATAALETRNFRHEILADAAARLISGDDPDTIVTQLFRDVADRLGIDICFNYVAAHQEGALRLGSHVGLTADEARNLARLPLGQAVCGAVAVSRAWAYVPEVQSSSDPRADLIRSMGVQAYASYPLEADGELLGTLSFGSRRRARFDDEELAFFRTVSHHVAAMKQRQLAERERALLSAELSHRVRNVFAVVQALAMQTDGQASTVDQFRDALLGRLRAQTRAHGLLLDAPRQHADLHGLLEEVLDAYRFERPDVLTCAGPSISLNARQTMSLSLILHELGTNAAKYGALTCPEGRVHITWSIEEMSPGRGVRLTWTEREGPLVTPPQTKGFGTRLIEQAAQHELGGRAELVYLSEGLRCVIEFRLG